MGCLDAVLEMGHTGFHEEEEEDKGKGGSGRDCMGRCYRELCLQCGPLIAVFFCRAEQDTTGLQARKEASPGDVCFFFTTRTALRLCCS